VGFVYEGEDAPAKLRKGFVGDVLLVGFGLKVASREEGHQITHSAPRKHRDGDHPEDVRIGGIVKEAMLHIP